MRRPGIFVKIETEAGIGDRSSRRFSGWVFARFSVQFQAMRQVFAHVRRGASGARRDDQIRSYISRCAIIATINQREGS